jgi:hypothetical protein
VKNLAEKLGCSIYFIYLMSSGRRKIPYRFMPTLYELCCNECAPYKTHPEAYRKDWFKIQET